MAGIPGNVSRRRFLGGLAATTLGSVARASVRSTESGPALDVGDRKQLMLDGRFIADSTGVALAMNQPQKLGVVLDSSDAPWEYGPGGFFRVLEYEGRLRLYYGAFTKGGQSLALAESDDGLHWTRPSLGIVAVEGSRDNNLLYGDNAIDATVMIDPRDAPERRFKLFRSYISRDREARGVFAAYSADGIHFTEAGRVLPLWTETGLIADWDPRIGRYVVFTRVLARDSDNQRRVGRIETDDLLAPWPCRANDSDLGCIEVGDIETVLAADEQDPPFCDLYTNAAHIYPYAQDAYVMFPTPFRHFAPPRQPWFRYEPGNDYGLIEVQLAVSRDGVDWSRTDRRPYVAPGLPDEWDRWMTMMGSGMVRREGSLLQYYWSTGRTHDSGILRPEYDESLVPRNAIGAVRQRLDGFVSADFAYAGGTLLTPPLIFGGSELRLNLDTGAVGTLRAEVADPDGHALPGHSLDECEELGGSFLDARVRWQGRTDLGGLRGQAIRLRFAGRAAKLYAFQFAAGEDVAIAVPTPSA